MCLRSISLLTDRIWEDSEGDGQSDPQVAVVKTTTMSKSCIFMVMLLPPSVNYYVATTVKHGFLYVLTKEWSHEDGTTLVIYYTCRHQIFFFHAESSEMKKYGNYNEKNSIILLIHCQIRFCLEMMKKMNTMLKIH